MPRNEHKRVIQQLSEAYQNVYKESREIPSEEFNVENQYGNATTYAIFVGVDSLPHFQKIAQQKGYKGLQFLKIIDPDLDKDGNPQEQGVITMPAYESGGASHSPSEIKNELYKHNPPDNEFWGQQGVGYAGKHWVSIDDTQSIDEYNPGYGKVPPIEDAEDTDWDAWNRAENEREAARDLAGELSDDWMKQDYESRQEDAFKPGDIVEAGPFRDGEPDHLEVVLTIDGDVVNTIPIADDAYGNKYGGRGGLDIELIRPLGDGEPDSREQFNPMEFPSDES